MKSNEDSILSLYYISGCAALTDSITQTELEKRDAQIKELSQKYSSETERRQQTENERDNFREELVRTDKNDKTSTKLPYKLPKLLYNGNVLKDYIFAKTSNLGIMLFSIFYFCRFLSTKSMTTNTQCIQILESFSF